MPGEANKVTTNLGRVSIVPKGVYDPETVYTRLDYVLFGDDGYLARKSGLQGVTPEEGEDWMKAVGSGSAAAAKEAAAQAAASAESAAGSVQVLEENREAIQSIRDNLEDIQAVSGGMEAVQTVGGQIGAVQTVSQGMEAVRTAAENLEAIQAAPEAADRAEAADDDANLAAERAEEAANRAQSIAQGAKGYYETPETLRESVPEGTAGDWAIVGSTDTIWVWDRETAGWKDSHQATDLSNYYTKDQADEENNKLLANITQATDGKISDATETLTGQIDVAKEDLGTQITEGLAEKLGKEETAAAAEKLETPRNISISGGATAAAKTFDGSAAVNLEVTALDVSKATAGTLAIARGGTGAAAAATALSNLGGQPKHTAITVSLAVASWSASNTITVNAAGVTASNTVIISPAPASFAAYGEAGVRCTAQAAGKLTFTADSKPTAALTVNVVIFN